MPETLQILQYEYVPDMAAKRTPYRQAHLDLIAAYHGDGRIVMAGALGNPPHGALFVFLVDDPAQVEEFVAGNPYIGGGIVTGHRVEPWNVVI